MVGQIGLHFGNLCDYFRGMIIKGHLFFHGPDKF